MVQYYTRQTLTTTNRPYAAGSVTQHNLSKGCFRQFHIADDYNVYASDALLILNSLAFPNLRVQ